MELTDYQEKTLARLEAEGAKRVENCSRMPCVEINNRRYAISPAVPPPGPKKIKELLRCVPTSSVDRTPMKTR